MPASVSHRLDVAAELAQRFGARLVALHVRRPFEARPSSRAPSRWTTSSGAYEDGGESRRGRRIGGLRQGNQGQASDDRMAGGRRLSSTANWPCRPAMPTCWSSARPSPSRRRRRPTCPRRWRWRPGVRSWSCRTSASRTPGKTVMLCWNSSRESARAAADAMPFLTAAEKVIVLAVDPRRRPRATVAEPGADVARLARPPRRQGHGPARRGGRHRCRQRDPVARRRPRRRSHRDGHLRPFARCARWCWAAPAGRCCGA